MRRALLFLTAIGLSGFALSGFSSGVSAGTAWDELRPLIFDERPILPGDRIISLKAPVRPEDQSFVPVEMAADFHDGRTIKAVTFIVDENPVPVAAEFAIGGKRQKLKLATRVRLNRETQIRAVVEASDGQLYMASRFVKFAGGQAACSAPPMGDPATIAANIGRMDLVHEKPAAAITQIRPTANLRINHPNHTGMARDQITLLYVPMRIISDIEVRQGDELVFTMHGSMTMSQDPEISFDYHVNGARTLQVLVTDSDDTSWEQSFPIGQGS